MERLRDLSKKPLWQGTTKTAFSIFRGSVYALSQSFAGRAKGLPTLFRVLLLYPTFLEKSIIKSGIWNPGRKETGMSKILELTFLTQSGKEMQLSIPNPVADLTMTTVKMAAADIMPVLRSSSGDPVSSFKSARYQTTSVEEITD